MFWHVGLIFLFREKNLAGYNLFLVSCRVIKSVNYLLSAWQANPSIQATLTLRLRSSPAPRNPLAVNRWFLCCRFQQVKKNWAGNWGICELWAFSKDPALIALVRWLLGAIIPSGCFLPACKFIPRAKCENNSRQTEESGPVSHYGGGKSPSLSPHFYGGFPCLLVAHEEINRMLCSGCYPAPRIASKTARLYLTPPFALIVSRFMEPSWKNDSCVITADLRWPKLPFCSYKSRYQGISSSIDKILPLIPYQRWRRKIWRAIFAAQSVTSCGGRFF